MRPQTLEVPGQEILTKDKVTVRVNISAVFEVVDATAAHQGVMDVQAHLYRSLQVAVRQSLGKRTLEELKIGDREHSLVKKFYRLRMSTPTMCDKPD